MQVKGPTLCKILLFFSSPVICNYIMCLQPVNAFLFANKRQRAGSCWNNSRHVRSDWLRLSLLKATSLFFCWTAFSCSPWNPLARPFFSRPSERHSAVNLSPPLWDACLVTVTWTFSFNHLLSTHMRLHVHLSHGAAQRELLMKRRAPGKRFDLIIKQRRVLKRKQLPTHCWQNDWK